MLLLTVDPYWDLAAPHPHSLAIDYAFVTVLLPWVMIEHIGMDQKLGLVLALVPVLDLALVLMQILVLALVLVKKVHKRIHHKEVVGEVEDAWRGHGRGEKKALALVLDAPFDKRLLRPDISLPLLVARRHLVVVHPRHRVDRMPMHPPAHINQIQHNNSLIK